MNWFPGQPTEFVGSALNRWSIRYDKSGTYVVVNGVGMIISGVSREFSTYREALAYSDSLNRLDSWEQADWYTKGWE